MFASTIFFSSCEGPSNRTQSKSKPRPVCYHSDISDSKVLSLFLIIIKLMAMKMLIILSCSGRRHPSSPSSFALWVPAPLLPGEHCMLIIIVITIVVILLVIIIVILNIFIILIIHHIQHHLALYEMHPNPSLGLGLSVIIAQGLPGQVKYHHHHHHNYKPKGTPFCFMTIIRFVCTSINPCFEHHPSCRRIHY